MWQRLLWHFCHPHRFRNCSTKPSSHKETGKNIVSIIIRTHCHNTVIICEKHCTKSIACALPHPPCPTPKWVSDGQLFSPRLHTHVRTDKSYWMNWHDDTCRFKPRSVKGLLPSVAREKRRFRHRSAILRLETNLTDKIEPRDFFDRKMLLWTHHDSLDR